MSDDTNLPLIDAPADGPAPAPAVPPVEEPKAKPQRKKPVEARVLQDCAYGPVNAVVTVPADELADAKANGLVDDNADAVSYAKSLAGGEA